MTNRFTQNSMQKAVPSVWVVDDDEDDQLFIRTAFASISPPISVLTLNDGEELLPKLAEYDELPQLILLDINMPYSNGFDTLKQLRTTSKYATLPVVMLTTSSDESDRQHSLSLGADQFITKPANFNQLIALTQRLARQLQVD
ncbi:response regulator [Spirosoma soli]|uniref:Response regulator n=1 Tax=Spirosoma soli TaxID=1770529 RepID=A0ABW5M8G9_9BACT